MVALIDFLFLILEWLLNAVFWLVFAWVIVGWLVQFDVINLRNRLAAQIVHGLDSVIRPILLPLRRIIPPLGALDITPMLLGMIILAANATIIPALHLWLDQRFGGA